jgi:zinc protease
MASVHVSKKVLSNGLTVLALEQRNIPKVSLQIWYGVGSKDEQSGERGIAHLIEHMIFKGTGALSESDINLITQKLSGSCNAFTSYDYTGYLFDMPVEHWHYALPIMADCMKNATFKEELLNSEMKAVVQELRMYNDDYTSVLLEKLIAAIFPDHPYHHPVIGYKQDLWNMKRENLLNFYRKHYCPNNAHLVVVGAVTAEEVFAQAEAAFGALEPIEGYKRPEFYHANDIVSQSVTIHRDIKQPHIMLAWQIPGTAAKIDYLCDVVSWILGSGKSARLVKRLVDDEALATDVETFVYDMFEYGLFIISIQPKNLDDVPQIIASVHDELAKVAAGQCTPQELTRAQRKTEMDFLSTIEDQERCAYIVGKLYAAHHDENYLSNYVQWDEHALPHDVAHFVKTYLHPSLMHKGAVASLAEADKDLWVKIQQESDAADYRILSRIKRECSVEDGKAVHAISVNKQEPFVFPRANEFILSNGLKVLFSNMSRLEKIDVMLEFKARGYYDPEDKQGLMAFMMDMIQEGTKKYPGSAFATELETHGISLSCLPGQITMSMVKSEFGKALELLNEMLVNATFEATALEKVRAQILADITEFWDSPGQFVGQLARDAVYGKHPYHKSYFGSRELIKTMTREDIVRAYQTYLSPIGSKVAIVGDVQGLNLEKMLQQALGDWQGNPVADLTYPPLKPLDAYTIDHQINRDQTVLAYAGLSIDRFNKDFDKILLFDQILTGGSLGTLASRLFQIREQTGLFYTIGGSLLAGTYLQPGMMFFKTIVSPEQLAYAEQLLEAVLAKGASDVSDEEFTMAQAAISHALIDNFATNKSIAASFLFLDTFNFPPDFFDNRAAQLMAIKREEMQEAVARLLKVQNLVKIRIGRLK